MPDTIHHIQPKVDTTIVPLNSADTAAVAVRALLTRNDSTNTTTPTATTATTAQQAATTSNKGLDGEPTNTRNTFVYTDSVCVMPLPPLFEAYDAINATDTIAKVELYQAKPIDVYGTLSRKQSEAFSELTVGEGHVIFTPLKTIWLDGVAVGIIIYFILVIAFTRRFITTLFPLLFNQQKAHKQFEENSQSFSFSRRLYFLPAMIIFSIYFVFANNTLNVLPTDMPLYQPLLIIVGTISVIAVFKQVILQTIGFVTLSSGFVSELSFNRQLILIASTILLFPIVIALSLYHNETTQIVLLSVGFIILAATWVGILIRSFLLFRFWRISPFLWILYLCILEIAPYLVLCVLFQ